MIAIVVPFADFRPEEERAKELGIFLQHMRVHIPLVFDSPVCIIVVEQLEPPIFNRGQLLNLGALRARELNEGLDSLVIVTHDVDILPDEVLLRQYEVARCDAMSFVIVDSEFRRLYGATEVPIGGAIAGTRANVFFAANGYPNNFWGWGMEDYIYSDRLKRVRARTCRAREGRTTHIDTLRLKGTKKEHMQKHKLKNMVAKEMRRDDARTWKKNGVSNVDGKAHIANETNEVIRNLTVLHMQVHLWRIDYDNVRDLSLKIYSQLQHK